MMNEMNTDNSNDASGNQDDQNDQSGTPLDAIISKVDGYIQDPKTVTVETLQELKSDLEDLKSYIDKEETGEGESGGMSQDGSSGEHPGLAIMIGKMRGGQK